MFREIFESNLFLGPETGIEYFLTNSFIFHFYLYVSNIVNMAIWEVNDYAQGPRGAAWVSGPLRQALL